MSVNQKIIKYLDFKGVSQREFTNKCKLSEGVLRRGKNIGSGYLSEIKTNYPDLNMNWVLFDEGEMIVTHDEETNKSQKQVSNLSLQIQLNNIYEKLNEVDCFMNAVRLKVEIEEELKEELANSVKIRK